MISGRKLTRDEVWKRIRETSKQDFILAEMKRLGFWPDNSAEPTLAESFIEERKALQEKLRTVSRDLAKVATPELALKQLHKERKQAALVKREETRRKHNAERFRRATDWHAHQQQTISYLGEGIFAPLAQKALDHPRLAGQKLPLIGSAAELAAAMGISVNELRFLCYQRDVSTVSHYQRFSIPKKSGGERVISAPMPRLKRAQYWLLANILEKAAVTDNAHGFVKQRNIVSNALPHVGKAVVVNLDLENFFPSISYPRVKGIYRQLGYSEEVATLCAMLSTEPATTAYELDGQRYFVKTGDAQLPQGAPTSPAISNLLCRRLDKRLRGAAAKLGFIYTRYADDLTFSAPTADGRTIRQLLWRVRKIIDAEGLKVHPAKTQVMRSHQRQEVTGVVVNKHPSVCREELKKFRALLFQIGKDGPDGKRWREGSLFNSIEGYANFVAMVNPAKGKPLQTQVAELRRKYKVSLQSVAKTPLSPENFRAAAAAGKAPRDHWWKAQPKPLPVLELTQEERLELKRKEKAARAAAEEAANPKPARPAASAPASRSWNTAQPRPEQRQPASGGTPTWVWWLVFVLIWFAVRAITR